MLLLREICCRWCGFFFTVCRPCWRGQRYCGDACRLAAKRHNHSKAQRKYRSTEKGKRSHRLSENRRRYRLNKKNHENEKNMDDATSTGPSARFIGRLVSAWNRIFGAGEAPRCQFCGSVGRVVAEFPRRGYG